MPSLVMDFIHGVEGAATDTGGAVAATNRFLNKAGGELSQEIASPFEYLGKNAIVDPARQLAAQVTGNQQAAQNAQQSTYQNLGLGQSGTNIGSALKGLASNTAQVGLDVAAPGIAKGVGTAVEGTVDLGTSAAGKVASGVIKGATEGAAIGGPQGVAQGVGQKNGKSLAMDFIQGAGEGAAIGGAFGGAGSAVSAAKDAIKPVHAYTGGKNATSFDEQQSTFQGADYKTRFEADDSQATTTPLKPGYNDNLSNVLQHPTLYKDYPQLADVKVSVQDLPAGSKAAFLPNKNTIVVDSKTAADPEQFKSALLHETQHAIQNQEGFAQGTNLSDQTAYQNNPGEAEARQTQQRMNMTPEQRIANPIPKPSDQFTPGQLDRMAKSQSTTKIANQLKPVVGDVVAQKIAPAIATTNDHNVISNIVDNAVNQHLAPATSDVTGTAPVSPSPVPVPPPTPTGDINTPAQVEGQASAAEAAYNPQASGTPSPLAKSMATGNETPEQVQARLDEGVAKNAQASQDRIISPPESGIPQSDEESLAASAPPAESFMNAPGEAPSATSVGKASTMGEMQGMLNSGQFTNDELLMHYMKSVPGSTMEDATKALDDTINSAGTDKSKINASLNPESGKVHLAPVGKGDGTGAQLNGRNAGQNIGKVGEVAYKDMEALNPQDRELTRYLRGKPQAEIDAIVQQAKDPVAFQKFVNDNKTYLDTAQAQGAELDQPLPYRANYGTRTPYDPPEGIPGVTTEGEPGTPKAGTGINAGYTKQRFFNTHEEALTHGYTPVNDDPLDDLRNDINQRAANQTSLALAKGYEGAYPGQVKVINNPSDPIPSGYRQLLIPGGKNIYLPDSIATKINERVMSSTPGKILGKYDSINAGGKELELGGGTFHGFNTAGTFVGQQLASGKAFTDSGATGKVVANFFSDKHMQSYMNDASDVSKSPSGGLDENHSLADGANASGLNMKNASADLENPEEKNLAGKIASIPGLKQVHEAVFSRQIPTMMLETFRQKTQGLDIFGSADDRLKAEGIARGINKEFGVTDHDLAGMTSRQFQTAGRFMLAPGYQEGVIHTLATALDPRNIGSAEGRLAREAVFGKALLFGGLATAGSIAGGDFKGQTPKQIALGIMNKAINPSFNIAGYKVSTPATNISDLAKPIEESISGYKKSGNAAKGLEDFASSHLAFAPSKAEEITTNKNYAGNPIHGTDYYGRPIPASTTVENLLSGIAPIPLAQTAQTATGQQSTGAAIANTLGFNASPVGNTQYAPVAAQTYLQRLQATPGVSKPELAADTKFVEALGSLNTSRSKTVAKAETAYIAKDKSKMQSIMASYNNQLAKALLPWEQSGGAKYMTPTMIQLLRTQTISYKDVGKNAIYNTQTNPTAYGVPISALAQAPPTHGTSTSLINNLTTTRI